MRCNTLFSLQLIAQRQKSNQITRTFSSDDTLQIQHHRHRYYCTLDAVTNATTNESFPFRYKSSSNINLDMFFQNATGHITTSEITVIYSIHLSL